MCAILAEVPEHQHLYDIQYATSVSLIRTGAKPAQLRPGDQRLRLSGARGAFVPLNPGAQILQRGNQL